MDDTTICRVAETVDLAIDRLNKALGEFYNWCPNNRLTLHARKSEVILFTKGTLMGPITTVYLGRLSATFSYQDETVRSDSRPETQDT